MAGRAIVGLAVGVVVGLSACTGAPGAGAGSTATPTGAPVASSGAAPTTDAQPSPPPAAVPEAPHVVDRDAYAFRTPRALRAGATYRLRMPGNLFATFPGSALTVEITPSDDAWWLFEQGIVVETPTFVREDAGIRVMELDGLPFGPCRAQTSVPTDPGPTPGDLAREVLSRYPFKVIEPITATARFGGSGVHLTAQLDDPEAGLCDNGGVMTYRPMAAQQELVELWVVVVHGERVVVERSWFPDTSRKVLAAQQATLDSLRLVPL
ncbi:hypothetical protein [Terrabacter sp. 2RAF25]|uniref:hypothetical protein n=1 Tax=Terrabacter sp. 2RAF25 TaxID=3232998 RepID=UPI003F9BE7FD